MLHRCDLPSRFAADTSPHANSESVEMVDARPYGAGQCFGLGAEVDREVVFLWLAVTAGYQPHLLDMRIRQRIVSLTQADRQQDLARARAWPPQPVVVVATDDRRQVICLAQQRERARLAIIDGEDARLGLLAGGQRIIGVCDGRGHAVPAEAIT